VNGPLVQDMVVATVAVRVLGRDLVVLARRAAAAGVRAGIRELRRGGPEGRE
jgi:hypothetical protein